MNAKEAVNWLEKTKWKNATVDEKLELLVQVRKNLKKYMGELARSDTDMKNSQIGEDVVHISEGMLATAGPVGGMLSACIDLYKSLKKGKMPEPLGVSRVNRDLHDIHVFPASRKDEVIYADRRDYLRVKGEPEQINPIEKPEGIIAVLGAGNYSSSIEMITALFLENCAVVHKPHHLNEGTDKVWEKIMKPLVDYKALSFCDTGGRDLVTDERLTKIYFTGGTKTAQAIMASTETEFISECGGNNPCIIVPGDKPWTEKELKHQAMQIASIAKMNGGAVCGRPQTLVTSRNWSQREEFLTHLKNALVRDTPAAGTHYPGSEDVAAGFLSNHPEAQVLNPENGKHRASDFVYIPGVGEDAYAVKNEAFCQIISEVVLDVPADADSFLPRAAEFCNSKLLGTLASLIIIDDGTAKNHTQALEGAVTQLRYGAVGINTMPPFIWMNPYLTWGGNEVGGEFVSGYGNFGNVLCYENVEKSISYSSFMSAGHMIISNKKAYHSLLENMSRYAAEPTWGNIFRMVMGMMTGSSKKDF